MQRKATDKESIKGHRYKRSRDLAQILSEPIMRGEMPVGSGLPTTRKLAEQYGVSINTVQLAMRELEARGLIRCVPRQGAIVTSRDEKPSVDAQAEGQKQIGILAPITAEEDVSHVPWSMRILHAAEEVFFEAGYSLTLLPYTEGAHWIVNVSDRLDRLSQQLVGIIHFADRRLDSLLTEIESRRMPWVSINRTDPTSSNNFVATDNVAAGRLVARCFGMLGFKRVAVITDDVNQVQSNLEKVTGFCQGWLEARSTMEGMEHITSKGITENAGYDAMKTLIAAGRVPQGVFTAGDLQGIGVMRALADAGISVPDQVGVVGSTGLALAERSSPSLSVMTQPMEQIGRQAATMLVQMIREGITQLIGRRIRGQFVIRESLRVPDSIRTDLEALFKLT